MTDSAVVFEDDADVARAAQYTRASERLVEVIEVLEPVEQGHDQRRFADRRADRLNRCIEAIGLGTQNDNVEGPVTSSCVIAVTGVLKLPSGLSILRPSRTSCSRRFGLTRKVTSTPALASRPPKYPPVAPAPRIKIRIGT